METNKETAAGLEGLSPAERSGLQGDALTGDSQLDSSLKRKEKGKERPDKSNTRANRHPALRALLWVLRKSVVPLLCLIAVFGGLYIGFTVIGKQPGDEVFEWSTWKHMYDLVFANS